MLAWRTTANRKGLKRTMPPMSSSPDIAASLEVDDELAPKLWVYVVAETAQQPTLAQSGLKPPCFEKQDLHALSQESQEKACVHLLSGCTSSGTILNLQICRGLVHALSILDIYHIYSNGNDFSLSLSISQTAKKE